MWQEILAVDSRLGEHRLQKMTDKGFERDVRPVYLKRRLQLLQAQQHRATASNNNKRTGSPSQEEVDTEVLQICML